MNVQTDFVRFIWYFIDKLPVDFCRFSYGVRSDQLVDVVVPIHCWWWIGKIEVVDSVRAKHICFSSAPFGVAKDQSSQRERDLLSALSGILIQRLNEISADVSAFVNFVFIIPFRWTAALMLWIYAFQFSVRVLSTSFLLFHFSCIILLFIRLRHSHPGSNEADGRQFSKST